MLLHLHAQTRNHTAARERATLPPAIEEDEEPGAMPKAPQPEEAAAVRALVDE